MQQPLLTAKYSLQKTEKSIMKGALLPTTEILKEAEGGMKRINFCKDIFLFQFKVKLIKIRAYIRYPFGKFLIIKCFCQNIGVKKGVGAKSGR